MYQEIDKSDKEFKERVEKLIGQVEYLDWEFHVKPDNSNPNRLYLQIKFNGVCSVTGKVERQDCRKWMLSKFMTDSEIVQTAYRATIAAVTHEAEEFFKWKGQPIFRPHYDIEALYEISRDNRISKRDNF